MAHVAQPTARRRLGSIAGMVVVGYVVATILAYLAADRMIFLPPRPSYDQSRLPVAQVRVDDDAHIAVLHLPNPAAAYTILYSHGNAEDLGYALPRLMELRDAGFAVVGYDYRGYGTSSGGGATALRAYRDHRAAYRYATDDLRIPSDRIIVYGRSVGSGPATELAADEPIAGLVLESAFTSAYVLLTRVPILPFDRFPNLKHIRRVRAPVLILHGTRDEVVPLSHGRRLFDAAPGSKQALWVEGAMHNDVAEVGGAAYTRALRQFADTLDARR